MADSTTAPESGADASSARDGTVPPPPADASADAPPPVDASVDVTDAGTICGPSNCPFGCCNGFGECVLPTNDACGWSGSACQQCPSNTSCEAVFGCSTTLQTCGPSNCAGCCNFSNPILCLPGTATFRCGFGGATCMGCPAGQQCRPLLYDAGGVCVPNDTCDPATCTGCCIGNLCAQGNQSNACGIGGVACQDCGADLCDNGRCTCGGPTGVPCDAGTTPVGD